MTKVAPGAKKLTVVKKVPERSYLVKTPQGNLLRRNCRFLRFTGEIPDKVTSPALLPTEPPGNE